MFETVESVLNAGAIFSGQSFQLRKSEGILLVGILQMLVSPVDGSDEFSVHAFWSAQLVLPESRFINGRRNHEIRLSSSGLSCQPCARVYPLELPIGRVILQSRSFSLVLYTKNLGPRYREIQVDEWDKEPAVA